MRLILIFIISLSSITVLAQEQISCCDDPECKQKAITLGTRMNQLLEQVPPFSYHDSTDKANLNHFRITKPRVYADLEKTALEIHHLLNTTIVRDCLTDAIGAERSENTFSWINFIKDKFYPPVFLSSEFKQGWRYGLELLQGNTGFTSRDIRWMGSFRLFMQYTFGKKGTAGNKWRIMVGPSLILQDKLGYVAVSSKLYRRIKDIAKPPFSAGNVSVFGGFDSNVDRFHLASVGGEVFLGFIGVNFSVNHSLQQRRQGFAVGLVLHSIPKKENESINH